jgi:hypothetical protein
MASDTDEFQETRDSTLIVKGRFKAGSLSLYGQFILIFKDKSDFDVFNAVVSTYSDLYDLEPHEDWLTYKEFIANAKWKGTFNASMTTGIMEQFKKFSQQMNSLTLLYNNVADYDYNAAELTLYDLVNRIVHGKDLILETAIQEITSSEYHEASAASTAAGSDEKTEAAPSLSEDYSLEEGSMMLTIKPIVAPVKGKPIYELRVGDKLMVYIQPLSEKANYAINQLDLREDKEIRPTAAQIIDIKAGSGKNNPVDILTLIAPGIYGKFTETEKQVRLKLYDPEVDGPIAVPRGGKPSRKEERGAPKEGRGTGSSKGTIIMLSLFLLILLLFVVLIFISW